jgi:phosphotransferase system HPr (HPr) family protein
MSNFESRKQKKQVALHRATVRVLDPIGLHARPAGQLVKLVNDSGLAVRIGRAEEDLVPANSPLRVMALKAKSGDELQLEVESEDSEKAKSLIAAIVQVLGASK